MRQITKRLRPNQDLKTEIVKIAEGVEAGFFGIHSR
jgi:hypothetical protein